MSVAHFDGETYDEVRDHARLAKQIGKVEALMRDGKWRTLAQIANETGAPEASISARLRDLRKPKFGGHEIAREYVDRGLYRYRMVAADTGKEVLF